MSTVDESAREPATLDTEELFRSLALTGAFVLVVAFVNVLYSVARIVGGQRDLLVVVAVALVAATLLSRYVSERVGAVLAAALFALGTATYLLSVPRGLDLLFVATDKLIADTVALLTGLRVLSIRSARVWLVGIAPAPVFLSWYLALRRRYVWAAVAGGAALGFLVLTGDAASKTTLAGTLGGIAAIGFGELERRGGTIAQADVLAVLFAVMAVLSLVVPLVPGGVADPVSPSGFGGYGSGPATLEGSLTSAPRRAPILGSIELSPKVSFVVESERARYWRVAAYDRFTGSGWIRTGQAAAYEGQLRDPPGGGTRLEQTYVLKRDLKAMPAAAYPVSVSGGIADRTLVTSQSTLLPQGKLGAGTRYTVTSEVVDPSPEELRAAGTDYPDRIREVYLQTPNSLSEAFRNRTRRITSGADGPYETARIVERYLEKAKDYSLDVDRPNGNVANAFLLRMDEGYCVYYATTMVMMLRSQGIPARYVVGYTPGQQVDDDTYVVRGLNSHAWVEVYFPDVGWVRFDPTPGNARQATERSVVEEAREEGAAGVDVDASDDEPLTPTPTPTPTSTTPPTTTANGTAAPNGTDGPVTTGRFGGIRPGTNNGTPAGTIVVTTLPDTSYRPGGSAGGGGGLPSIPAPEDAILGAILIAGALAGAHRSGLPGRAYQSARLRWQGPRRDPDEDVERAYERLELLLARRFRPRRASETPREYLAAMRRRAADERVDEVGAIYERAHYGDGVSRTDADRAVGKVDAMVRERTPIVGRLWRR